MLLQNNGTVMEGLKKNMKTVEKSRKLNVDANLGTTIFKKMFN